MSIHTNRLMVKFNIDAIERDFAFIQLKRDQGNYLGASQLDKLLGKEYQATAVMWQHGSYAYAMFEQPVNIYELISKIRKDKDFSDGAVLKALPRANVTESEVCISEAWLAQILLNSLASSKSRFKQLHYCNLTGALFIVPNLNSQDRDIIDAAKVVINRDYLLSVQIIRHRKLISVLNEIKSGKIKSESINSKPQYILDKNKGTLRRLLPRDGKVDRKKIYIPYGIQGKRASRNFLDFSSLKRYEESRAGIMHYVLDNIKEYLSDYMSSVALSPVETLHAVEELTETILKTSNVQSKLDGQMIHIVDRVNSEESYNLVYNLKKAISSYLSNKKYLTDGKDDKTNSLNIRIIHDADYYHENGKTDEHLASNPDISRQHITIESVEAFPENAVVKTIVKELLIKRDIGERNLRLFDWSKLNAKRTWTFAIQDDKSKRIVFMDISPDGHFEFRELDENNLFGNGEYQEYIEIISEAKSNEWKTNLSLEGLVISEDGDKNLILRTKEITIPDLINIKKIIAERDAILPEGKRTGSELALIVEQCFAEATRVDDKVSSLIEELRSIGDQELSKIDFRKKLNTYLGINTKIAAQLRSNLYDKHGIRLSFPKKKDSLNTLFDASLNIKYFGKTDSEACYFVGDRRENIQSSFKDACHLRKVVAVKGSKLIFKELLPTMNVNFVRTGQSTVVPFPFKYLREYIGFEE